MKSCQNVSELIIVDSDDLAHAKGNFCSREVRFTICLRSFYIERISNFISDKKKSN